MRGVVGRDRPWVSGWLGWVDGRLRRRPAVLPWLLILAGVLLPGCGLFMQALEPPRVELIDLRLRAATFFSQQYGIVLRLDNPNRYDLSFSGLDYEIDLNHEPFARGLYQQPTTLPALGSVTVELIANSSTVALLRQVEKLQQNGIPGAVPYRVRGRVLLAAGREIPFDYQDQVAFDLP